MFIRPGTSHWPFIDTTLAPAGTVMEPDGPTCAIRSPSINTVASVIGAPPSMLMTLPPTSAVTGFGSACGMAVCAEAVWAKAIAALSESAAAMRGNFMRIPL